MADSSSERNVSSDDESEGSAEGPVIGTRLSAEEIYENVRAAAVKELERPLTALFWSAVGAGLTIGFSFFAGAYLMHLASAPYKSAAAAAGYPLGFVFVVLARHQLFTENTLEPIIPLLNRPSYGMFRQVCSLCGVVLLGNIIGAFAFAGVAAWTPMLSSEFQKSLVEVAEGSTLGGFSIVAYRAIYAGWLIALMAWLIASTHSTLAQVVLVWLTTAPIAALEFRHSIAGSVEAFYRALIGIAGWADIIFGFIVPAIIGNVIGGVLFVALLNHGQVAANRSS